MMFFGEILWDMDISCGVMDEVFFRDDFIYYLWEVFRGYEEFLG
jgi:hypothetical protein